MTENKITKEKQEREELKQNNGNNTKISKTKTLSSLKYKIYPTVINSLREVRLDFTSLKQEQDTTKKGAMKKYEITLGNEPSMTEI